MLAVTFGGGLHVFNNRRKKSDMHKPSLKFILSAFVALLCLTSVAHALEPPVLKGKWASAALENYGSHFATRTFTFTDSKWRVTYRAYADAQGSQPLFRLEVGGFYVLGEVSAAVAGAFEGIFPANSRRIVAESDAGVAMFSGMGCMLEKGKTLSLVSKECGFVPGLMQAMGEYDLVAIKEGRLYFGDRSGDLTKARPAALTPYPLVSK
jgi:hypothetical protein